MTPPWWVIPIRRICKGFRVKAVFCGDKKIMVNLQLRDKRKERNRNGNRLGGKQIAGHR